MWAAWEAGSERDPSAVLDSWGPDKEGSGHAACVGLGPLEMRYCSIRGDEGHVRDTVCGQEMYLAAHC